MTPSEKDIHTGILRSAQNDRQSAGLNNNPGAGDDKQDAGAPHFVRGMGLFSATAIVMGSMIGSGIFIVWRI